jgi:type I restriction enzyme S subunit
VAVSGVELTTNQGFASFIVPAGIDPKFLGWWLRSKKAELEQLAGGTTFKEISKLDFSHS